jgi:hypothetical protein
LNVEGVLQVLHVEGNSEAVYNLRVRTNILPILDKWRDAHISFWIVEFPCFNRAFKAFGRGGNLIAV